MLLVDINEVASSVTFCLLFNCTELSGESTAVDDIVDDDVDDIIDDDVDDDADNEDLKLDLMLVLY